MEAVKENQLDKLALALCLGGVLLAVSVVVLGAMVNRNFVLIAYGVFAAFQIAAFVLGMITRAKPLGKTAAITSSVLLALSVLFLA